jgi:hypothetical protein
MGAIRVKKKKSAILIGTELPSYVTKLSGSTLMDLSPQIRRCTIVDLYKPNWCSSSSGVRTVPVLPWALGLVPDLRPEPEQKLEVPPRYPTTNFSGSRNRNRDRATRPSARPPFTLLSPGRYSEIVARARSSGVWTRFVVGLNPNLRCERARKNLKDSMDSFDGLRKQIFSEYRETAQ